MDAYSTNQLVKLPYWVWARFLLETARVALLAIVCSAHRHTVPSSADDLGDRSYLFRLDVERTHVVKSEFPHGIANGI